MTARDLLLSKRLPGNTLDQQAAAQRALAELANREIIVPQLSGIAPDAGLINAGTIVMGNGLPLGAGFTGVMQFADALEWPAGSGQYWNYISFNTDVMMYGVSSTDGRAYFLGGNAQIGPTGITMFTAEKLISQFIKAPELASFQMGEMSFNSVTTPAFIMYHGAESTALLNVNGNFDDGTLSSWTVATTGSGAVVTSNYLTKYGPYYAKLTSSGGTASITSNRIVVTALAIYRFEFFARQVGTSAEARIKWYNNTSGGSLLRTDTFAIGSTGVSSDFKTDWAYYLEPLDAPTGAQSCEIIFATTAATTELDVDEIAFKGAADRARGVKLTSDHLQHFHHRMESNIFYGDDQGYDLLGSNSTAAKTALTRSILGNTMGAYGIFHARVVVTLANTTGNARSWSAVDIKFGGTTLFTWGPPNSSSGNNKIAVIDVWVCNSGAASIQQAVCLIHHLNNNTTGSGLNNLLSAGSAQIMMGYNTAAIDTTVDKTFEILVTMSAASVNLVSERQYGDMLGPFEHTF